MHPLGVVLPTPAAVRSALLKSSSLHVFSADVFIKKQQVQLLQLEGSRQHQLSLLRMTAIHRVIF
jgi:hypothetical protein